LMVAVPLYICLTIAAYFLVLREMKPVGHLKEAILKMCNGAEVEIPAQNRRDELGDMARSFVEVHEKMLHSRQVEAAIAASRTPVTIVKSDGSVAFANEALTNLFATIGVHDPASHGALEGRAFADLKVDTDTGPNVSMDVKHVVVNGYTLAIRASVITNGEGSHTGTVLQIEDETEILAVQAQLSDTVKAASEGDFSKSVTPPENHAFLASIANGMNQLSQIVAQFVASYVTVLDKVSQGDLKARITDDFGGSLGAAAAALNNTIEQLRRERKTVNRVTASPSSTCPSPRSSTHSILTSPTL